MAQPSNRLRMVLEKNPVPLAALLPPIPTASIPPTSSLQDSEDPEQDNDELKLNDQEIAEALQQARERKYQKLLELERDAREAEMRRKLTEQWSVEKTRDFMQWKLKMREKKWVFEDICTEDNTLICNAGTVFELLCLYFSSDPNFVFNANALGVYKPDLRKGILLAGRIGCGKTGLMELFRVNQRQVFMLKNAADIAFQWRMADKEAANFLEKMSIPHLLPLNDADNFYQRYAGLCIDDIGTEDVQNSFGNRSNVIADIIHARYSSGAMGPMLHLTSNLNWADLTAFYGARVASRLQETMNMIEYKGADRRK